MKSVSAAPRAEHTASVKGMVQADEFADDDVVSDDVDEEQEEADRNHERAAVVRVEPKMDTVLDEAGSTSEASLLLLEVIAWREMRSQET